MPSPTVDELEPHLKYAGFWKRFVAGWIDGFVMLLPTIFLLWLESISRTWAFLVLLPATFMFSANEVYFHGRSGQTLGKKSQDIRVVNLGRAPISWKQAFMRSLVGIVPGLLTAVSTLVALSTMTDGDFTNLSWVELSEKKTQLSPYINQITVATLVWISSEVIVLLFNRKRRALHDFIAGTVVVEDLNSRGECRLLMAAQPNRLRLIWQIR